MKTKPLIEVEGAGWRIDALVLESGRVPVEEFLDDLEGDEADAFVARFQRMLSGAPFQAFPPKFKRYRGLWQVATHRYRILGFRVDDVLVLTNGFKKTANQTPPEEVERCEKLRDKFMAERTGGTRSDE